MFKKYQEQTKATFKPANDMPADKAQLTDWALGLGGEAGEVLDIIKHHVAHGESLDKMELAKELGDVLWYLSALCTSTGISLEDIAKLNLLKLSHRYSEGYNNEDSSNRHEKERALKDLPMYQVLRSRITKETGAPLNVIFIGPDGAGKTTLIKHIAARTDMSIIKCDYRPQNKVEISLEQLDQNIDVIYDRFYYPDDIVYSAVKGDMLPSEVKEQYQEVAAKLAELNPVIFYIDAPIEVLTERSKAWADDYVSIDDLGRIKSAYHQILKEIEALNIPVLRYANVADMHSTAYGCLINDIVSAIDIWRRIYKLGKVDKNNDLSE